MANSHDSTEPVAWAMPKGDGTFIDVITPAEHAREEGSYTVPLFAHPVAQQPQVEAVSDDLRDRLVAISQAIADQDDRAAQAMIREILAAPQQAEAVPSDVVRDAVAAEREACAALAQGYAGQVGDVAWAVAAAIRGRGNAAIAQQKGASHE